MYRGTTPTICFSLLSSIDMDEIAQIWLTFSMPRTKLTFTGERVIISAPNRKLYVKLTQEETLSFGTGNVKVQARILMRDGMAYASDVGELEVRGILMDGVVSEDEHGDSDPDFDGGG